MKNGIRIIPGIPDDDNRDYLPEKIKNTEIVVNENGNNSLPYPKMLIEYHGAIVSEEEEDTWFEYVPQSYKSSQKTPLVISMHGGLMTGWGQAIYTSWTMMADRDGFIVLFPNAHTNRVWTVPWLDWEHHPKQEDRIEIPPNINIAPENPEENNDIQLVLHLIDRMKSKYNIDERRIFMQGMSMGDMMTAQFARSFGNMLAGAAGSGASAFIPLIFDEDGQIVNRAGHTPIWQSRPELNGIPPRGELEKKMNKLNRLYWMEINECDPIPQISILGEHNIAFYKGKKAELVFMDVKNRDHGQTLDDAAFVWDYLFSGLARETDGSITDNGSVLPRKGDAFAIAVADGCSFAWLSNGTEKMSSPTIKWQKLKYHGLDGGQKVRGEYLCVPISFIARAFDARLTVSGDTLSAELCLKDGRTLQFARGSIGCVIDDQFRSMYCEAIHRFDELYISLEWFAGAIYNLHVSACSDVIYVTDHFSILSTYMADLLRDILKGEAVPENRKDMM